jgi:hypothetical protein
MKDDKILAITDGSSKVLKAFGYIVASSSMFAIVCCVIYWTNGIDVIYDNNDLLSYIAVVVSILGILCWLVVFIFGCIRRFGYSATTQNIARISVIVHLLLHFLFPVLASGIVNASQNKLGRLYLMSICFFGWRRP